MEYLAVVLNLMSTWDGAVAWSSQPSWWLLVLAGLGIIFAIRPGELLLSWRLRLCALAPTAVLLIPWSNFTNVSLNPGEFRATVLDIGQGTAVFIETANRQLLYDTGPIQGRGDDAGQRTILPYLRGRGIGQIDRMVISHSDSDHVGGAASLLKQISFREMMGSLPIDNPLLLNLRERKIPSIPCRYGQRWIWDGVEFVIWHPHQSTLFQKQYPMKPNEMSCVLEVRNKGYSFWLTGDVERQGEAEITNRLDELMLREIGDRQLIFMAPHHGSKTSSSIELLNVLRPDIAFAQNGYRNRYGHPHPTVTARYESLEIPFYQTPKTGAQIWLFKNSTESQAAPIFWRDALNKLWHRNGVNY
jgi:competence protein ComEC